MPGNIHEISLENPDLVLEISSPLDPSGDVSGRSGIKKEIPTKWPDEGTGFYNLTRYGFYMILYGLKSYPLVIQHDQTWRAGKWRFIQLQAV